jgi:transposase InsO family protein
MSANHQATTLQQRIEIGERAQRGETDPQIAAALQLSPSTVRKWRRKLQHEGRSGLAPKIGRPKSGILSTVLPELRTALRETRLARPGWGPQTLRLELGTDPRFQERVKLPSRTRIAAFLKAEGLTRRYQRHSELPQPPDTPPQAPHDEWEMDAQGVRIIVGVGRVAVINIGDPYSHLRVESRACLGKSKADTPDYQLALRRGGLRYGLPKRVTLDHDSAFFDNTCPSPYPSRLHLWLIALGVEVQFIPPGQPTAHGFIERTHAVVDQQALVGPPFDTPAAVQPTLEQRLVFLNTRYPCRSLGGQPPLTAYPAAHHSGREYRPEWEGELLDLGRVYQYLAQGRWFRQVSAQGQFSLGADCYGLGHTWAHQTIEITFDPVTQEFVCQSADGQTQKRVQAKGLTKADLMGELALEQFPNYQLDFCINITSGSGIRAF